MKVANAIFISTVQPNRLYSGSWTIWRCWFGSDLVLILPEDKIENYSQSENRNYISKTNNFYILRTSKIWVDKRLQRGAKEKIWQSWLLKNICAQLQYWILAKTNKKKNLCYEARLCRHSRLWSTVFKCFTIPQNILACSYQHSRFSYLPKNLIIFIFQLFFFFFLKFTYKVYWIINKESTCSSNTHFLYLELEGF